MKRFGTLAAAAALLLAATSGAARAEQWTFDVQPGERLTVDIETGGDIEIRGVAGAKVSISAAIGGRDRDEVVVAAERVTPGVRVTSKMQRRMRNYDADVDFVI
ncbi:MAG: hypothetical protein NDJ75_10220, partial [Thermoanaerobaculia bacterium]|nr:hypothetical protein [Thermoanaerobaculia bacterium]